MADGVDLTGRWTGVYFYPDDHVWNANDAYPPTPFTAELAESLGAVTGTTHEFDLMGPTPTVEIIAVIEGTRDGDALNFVKYPDSWHQVPIHYTGVIAPGGNDISGEWTIPGNWSGVFRMQRRDVSVSREATLETTA